MQRDLSKFTCPPLKAESTITDICSKISFEMIFPGARLKNQFIILNIIDVPSNSTALQLDQ